MLVGHKESDKRHQEARVSWSPGELILISKLPSIIKQGYIACKSTLKSILKVLRNEDEADDGRSHVGSFHLKTTFLYFLEKTPPSNIKSPFGLMMNLLHDLCCYVKDGKLPHYFLPECDLLSMVRPHERKVALKAIQTVLSEPIYAMVKCPSEPDEIFGDINPDDVMTAFHHVSTHPSCEQHWERLLLLLSRLDEWKIQHYFIQLQADEKNEERAVSERPVLVMLVDLLKHIRRMN